MRLLRDAGYRRSSFPDFIPVDLMHRVRFARPAKNSSISNSNSCSKRHKPPRKGQGKSKGQRIQRNGMAFAAQRNAFGEDNSHQKKIHTYIYIYIYKGCLFPIPAFSCFLSGSRLGPQSFGPIACLTYYLKCFHDQETHCKTDCVLSSSMSNDGVQIIIKMMRARILATSSV